MRCKIEITKLKPENILQKQKKSLIHEIYYSIRVEMDRKLVRLGKMSCVVPRSYR